VKGTLSIMDVVAVVVVLLTPILPAPVSAALAATTLLTFVIVQKARDRGSR